MELVTLVLYPSLTVYLTSGRKGVVKTVLRHQGMTKRATECTSSLVDTQKNPSTPVEVFFDTTLPKGGGDGMKGKRESGRKGP